MPADGAAARLLGRVAEAADELGDSEAARVAWAEARSATGNAAWVVVAGEKNRGKSRLINALVQRKGLLPVDEDIATCVHIRVYAAEHDEAWVVNDPGDDERGLSPYEHADRVRIPMADIAEYAALDRDTAEMRHHEVREVSVGLQSPLLAGLELIDTPGVGGLVTGHAELTMSALSLADALMFVVNGSSELTRSELRFLEQASERTARVLFVLTQIDKYPAWREVLARNVTLIHHYAPGFADMPWFPVSSLLRESADQAAESGQGADAVALEERSGLGALEKELVGRIAGQAARLREQNAARVARGILAKLVADQEGRLRSLRKDQQHLVTLRASQQRLASLTSPDAPWLRDLATEFRGLSERLRGDYERRVAKLQIAANDWITEADADTATQVAHDFDAGLRALWADLDTAARTGALGIAARITAKENLAEVGALSADIPYPEELTRAGNLHITPEAAPDDLPGLVARYLPSMSGISMTVMAGHLLFAAVPPLALLSVGGVIATLLHKGNQDKAAAARARADLTKHIQGVLVQVRHVVPESVHKILASLQDTTKANILARMEARGYEVDRAIADADANMHASEKDLAPQLAAAEHALRQLAALSAEVAEIGMAFHGAAA
jgi:hypothetical protein